MSACEMCTVEADLRLSDLTFEAVKTFLDHVLLLCLLAGWGFVMFFGRAFKYAHVIMYYEDAM